MTTPAEPASERRPLLAHTERPVHVVVSSPWLYPFKGMYYFMAHPFLWPLLRGRLLPCFVLSLLVYTLLFMFAYLPQVALMAILYGRALAWVNAALLVLGEGAAIVAVLFESFFVDETLVDIFDAVLVHEGLADLVANGRVILPADLSTDAKPNPVVRLGNPRISSVYAPFSCVQITEFVLLLPLTFFPLFGTPLFIVLTGYRAGPLQHWRYFKLRGMRRKDRNEEISTRQRKYTWFGTVHIALQFIPGLSMLFLLTSAAGAALWAAKLEKKRRLLGTDADAPFARDGDAAV